ncbi:hypothetical protein JCM6882_008294, partial [Rhodosporidiobolus microsporus]
MRIPFLRSLSHSSRRAPSSHSRLPLHVLGDDDDDAHGDRRDEATIPLTSLDPDDSDAPYPSSSSSRKRAPQPTSVLSTLLARLPVRKLLALAVVLVGIYKLHRWTSNNTDYYDRLSSHLDAASARYNPWHPKPAHVVYIDQPESVAVRGRRYRAAKERRDDRYLGWKAVPYGKDPSGEGRFRVSSWLDEVEEGAQKEMVMDRWDEGCVRPRPREDGHDGPREHFDGHEDCLKLNIFSPISRENNTLLPVML